MPRRLADLYEHGRFIRSAGAGAVGMTDEQGPDHRDFKPYSPSWLLRASAATSVVAMVAGVLVVIFFL
jgi:hypothetical protein